MEFIEIGEKGTVNGKLMKCVENVMGGCAACSLQDNCHGGSKSRPACMAHERPDRKSVTFKSAK